MNRFFASITLLLLPLLVACSGGNDAPENLDPAKVLASAVSAIGDVQTFHFQLTHENGTTPMPLNLQLSSAEGDVAVPDKLTAKVRAKASNLNVDVEVIGIGNQTWVTNPFTRRWQTLPGATIKDIADPAALAETLVQQVKNARIESQDEVLGAASYHLTGTIDSAAIASALPIAEPGHNAKVDIWIGTQDALPRRARITGRLTAGEPENIVRQVDFSSYDAGVSITPPQ
jgi:hypothetical protein